MKNTQNLHAPLLPSVQSNFFEFSPFRLLTVSLVLLLTAFQGFAAPVVGLAKDATVAGREVTFNFYIENLGDTELTSLSLPDDLDTVFGAGNYSVTGAPSFVDNPNTITLNSGYNGSGDTQIITAGTLAVGDTAQVQLTVELTSFSDQGMGVGIYSNSTTITTTSSSDVSDSGTDPDLNGNSDPTDSGEDDPTVFSFVDNPVIGVAKNVTLNGSEATFDFYLEAYGNATLQNLSLVDDLDAVFGAGNYSISSSPSFVDNPGTLTLNGSYDGSASNQLISSGTLAVGDTAQIRLVVDITTVADLGDGLGVYSNQVTATATSPAGKATSDLSDLGTAPDPSGDGNPRQFGENDPTTFVVGEEPQIGASLTTSVSGSEVTLNYYLENLGNTSLNNVNFAEDLDAVFGASNYFILTSPSFIDNPGTLTLDPLYNGRGINDMFSASSTLAAGDTAQVQMVVKVLTIADLGSGSGIYSSQVLATGSAPGGAITSDLSDNGTDPDPNGNGDPTESGENDATPITVAENGAIGVSKTYTLAGFGAFTQVTTEFRVENIGNVALTNITMDDDLNAVYGAGNYTHFTDPTFASGTNTVNLNTAYNGGTNIAIFNAGSSLAPGEHAVIRMVQLVTALTDQGFGSGIYQNQVTVNATAPAGAVSDLSDAGSVVDANGNGNSGDANEDDPTIIELNSLLGLAIDANVANNVVTLDFILENFGSSTISNIELDQSLDSIFGAGNYTISSAPSLTDDPGTFTLEAGFDGSATPRLLSTSSSLAGGDTAAIRLVVTVNSITNPLGTGLGDYSAASTLFATGASGQSLSDTSTNGTDPDANANDTPLDDSTATTFSITQDVVVGAAVNGTVAGNQITLDFYLENFGSATGTLSAFTQDLDSVFGSGNYSIVSPPAFVDDPGTITLNGGYDGSGDTNLISAASSTLAAADTAQIQLVLNVTNITDQGDGNGIYEVQSAVSGTNSGGIAFSDLSDNSTDPDSDGNGDPTDKGLADPPVPGNDDPLVLLVGNSTIGIAHSATVSGTQVTMDVVIENLGTTKLESLSINDTLFTIFGFGNFSVTSAPVLLPGSAPLSVNATYNGTFSTALVFNSTLEVGERAVIRYVIDITNVTDQGSGLGVYNHQITVTAIDPVGAAVTDLSDNGLITDTDGDGEANEAGENDITTITIGEEAVLGLAIDTAAAGSLVTVDYYLENLGNSALNSVSFAQNLDSIFGAGNYTINTPSAFIDDPGTLTLNGAFDGSSNSALLSAGSTLAAGDTAQIRLIVDITTLSDQGFGTGAYSLQSHVLGIAPLGSLASDISDAGTDPDPNGNSFPSDAGENDASLVSLTSIALGSALEATVSGKQVTLTYRLSNLTNTTESLTNVLLPVDLDTLFGAGNYSIVSGPTLESAPRSLNINTDFNGSSDTALITTSSIGPGVTDEVSLVISVDTLADNGGGLGVYSHQVTPTAQTLAGPVSDLSDEGSNPDANSNGFPRDAGEEDPTAFTVAEVPTVGLALQTSVTGRRVTLDYYLESFANVTASNISLPLDLDSIFGAGNYTISTAPQFITDPGTLTLNGGFNGSGTTGLISAGTLAVSATAQIRVVVDVTTVTDQGSGLGIYSAQSTISADAPGGGSQADSSDSGTDPDPNGNSDPTEAGENDASPVTLQGSIGDFVWSDLNGNGVQDGGAEVGLAGVTVYLDSNGNGMLDGGEPSDVTDGSGAYGFAELAAGSYSVRVDPTTIPSGFVLTTANMPHAEILFAGEEQLTVDFGYQQQNASIGDFVWNDLNGNGVQDGGEPGIAGVTVYLDSNSNGTLDGGEPSDTTDGAGAYDFTALPAGSYSIAVDLTTVTTGFNLTTGNAPLAKNLVAGEDFNSADFGFQQQDATIGDFVWNDLNGNGVQDGGEPGLAGVTIFLDSNSNGTLDGGEPSDTTDGAGAYDITSLPTGSYSVRVVPATVPTNFVLSTANIPLSKSLAAGEDFNGADFGYRQQIDLVVDVSESASTGIVVAGSGTSNLSYTVKITNNGPSTATNIVIGDTLTLPPGVSLESAAPSQGTRTGNSWSVGTLNAGNSATLTFVTTVGSATAAGTDVVGVAASVSSVDQPLILTTDDSDSEFTEVVRIVDIVVTVTASTDTVVAGSGTDNLTYTTTVRNNGPSEASGLTVNSITIIFGDVTPSSSIPSAGTSLNGSTWEIGTLAPGASATLLKPLTVGPSASIGSNLLLTSSNVLNVNENLTNTSDDSDSASVEVTRNVDIAVSVAESTDPVVAGSATANLVSTITVTNNGPSDATGVVLNTTRTLPSGVSIFSITNSTGSISLTPTTGSSATTWTLGNLATGASETFIVRYTVGSSTAEGTDVITNAATLTAANENLINTTDDSDSESSSVTREVDIAVSVAESIDPVVAGSGANNLVYTVTARNNGPSDATGVELSNALTLPANVSSGTITPSLGTSFSGSTWTVGSLVSGNSATLTVNVTAAANAVSGTDVISNTATLTATNETLINTGNDSSTERTSITREVDLIVTVAESIDPAVAGSGVGNLVYTVTATNNGPSDASGVTLSNVLNLPANVSTASISPSSGTFTDPTWTLGNLATGTFETLTVTLTVGDSAAAGTDVIANTATVTGANETLIDTTDDSDSEATSVVANFDITVSANTLADPLVAGGNVLDTFELIITNNGPSVATNLQLNTTLTLPTGVTVDAVTSGGTTNSYNDMTGVWSIPSLAVSGTATVTLSLGADSSTAAGLNTVAIAVNSASAIQTISTLPATYQVSSTASVINVTETQLALTSTLSLNQQTGLIDGNIKVTNNNPVDVPAFRIYITNLPSDVTVQNASGTATWNGVAGVPYFLINTTTAANGGMQNILAQYFRANRDANFDPTYEIELLDQVEGEPGISLGAPVTLTRPRFILPTGDVLIEWASTIGTEYVVQYSADMVTWKTVTPTITANATAMQWVDNGLPKTDSHPSTVTKRFYRVFEVSLIP